MNWKSQADISYKLKGNITKWQVIHNFIRELGLKLISGETDRWLMTFFSMYKQIEIHDDLVH